MHPPAHEMVARFSNSALEVVSRGLLLGPCQNIETVIVCPCSIARQFWQSVEGKSAARSYAYPSHGFKSPTSVVCKFLSLSSYQPAGYSGSPLLSRDDPRGCGCEMAVA